MSEKIRVSKHECKQESHDDEMQLIFKSIDKHLEDILFRLASLEERVDDIEHVLDDFEEEISSKQEEEQELGDQTIYFSHSRRRAPFPLTWENIREHLKEIKILGIESHREHV